MYKHSSLLQIFVSYDRKMFYSTGPMALLSNIALCCKCLPRTNTLAFYKKSIIYGRKMFYSTGPWPVPYFQTLDSTLDKHSRLLQIFVSYGRKKLYKIVNPE